MKHKRVMLMVSEFPKLSETFIVNQFLGLLHHGWDVHVVCQRSSKKEWAYYPLLKNKQSLRQRVHQVWPHSPTWLAVLLMPAALIIGLLSRPRAVWHYLLKGYRRFGLKVFKHYYLDLALILRAPGVIHFEFGSLAAQKMYLKEFLECKISVSFRGYDLNFVGLEDPGYYAEVWQKADHCHFLGEDLWQRALRRGCPQDKPHSFIPPAVDSNQFSRMSGYHVEESGTLAHPLRILSVGRLEWKKGYEHALMAVRLLKEMGICFEYRIIGEGEYKAPLFFTRHQLGLEEEVKFMGGMVQEQVKTQLEWADVFLHTSLSEGFCNAVLEAQAMQLPVVCSDAGGLPENVADGISGFVVGSRNSLAMAEKLALLAINGTLREKMGIAGRERVKKYFGLELQTRRWDEYFQGLR